MKSLLGALLPARSGDTPVPFAPRRSLFGAAVGGQANPENLMAAMGSVGTLFAIVHRLSNATAQVEWHLYRRAPSGDPSERVEVTKHAALDLWNAPNWWMANVEFTETFQQHLDLTGEAWWVIGRNGNSPIPLELWPVRPDRMTPVPHPTEFLSGFVYTSPDGENVPLGRDQVIQLRMPNPLDPYRGMGPVQAILADLDATRYSAEWNRNFFLNSAEPGGLIEVDRRLNDAEFEELRLRWQEQHRGVANAHRVAILEAGKWVDRKFSQREMQFAEIRNVNREMIREAFGIAGFSIGDIKDVNRATADASSAWFAAQMTVPRCERIKYALNYQLLPLFGPMADGLEFDYDNPTVSDREQDTMQLTAQAKAANELVLAGYDPADAAEAVGLPEMGWVGVPAPGGGVPGSAPVPVSPAAPAAPAPVPSRRRQAAVAHTHGPGDEDPFNCPACRPPWLRNAADEPAGDSEASAPETRADWERRVDALVAEWVSEVSPGQFDELVAQVAAIVEKGAPSELSELHVDVDKGAEVLTAAMYGQAIDGARRMVDVAAAAGVDIVAVVPVEPTGTRSVTQALAVRGRGGAPVLDRTRPKTKFKVVKELAGDLAAAARITATNLAHTLTAGVAREAMRVWAPGSTADDVSGRVRDYLEGLTTSTLGTELSAAIWSAENEGRFATLDEAEDAGYGATTYTASEVNDRSTCDSCAEVDGTVYASIDDAKADYPFGGFKDCQGGNRCRGTIEPQWSGS